MDLLIANLSFIGKGLIATLALSACSLLGATLLACVLGVASVAETVPVRRTARGATELFRGLPLIVNVFFVFFGLPGFGLQLSPFAAIVLSLSVWGGANGAEIVRGGLQSVPAHQLRSAMALGMRPAQVMLLVRVPQAVRAILPAYVGLATQVVQATSLGALIGVTEFMKVGQNIVERVTVMEGWNPAFAVYAGVLLVYFAICSVLTAWGRRLERGARGVPTPAAASPPAVPAHVPLPAARLET